MQDKTQDKRRHKRYSLDLIEVHGKMSLTDKVEVLDISLGGVALRADRRLNIGKEYLIKLQKNGKLLEVKGIVVRSELSGMEARGHGEMASIYSAGLVFKDGYAVKIADFLTPIAQQRKKESPAVVDRRQNIKFKVRSISLGGMLIQTHQPVEINSTIPMDLSLNTDKAVQFTGRTVSCTSMEIAEQTYFDIGVEFTDLTDMNKELLNSFIDYLALLDDKQKG